MQNVSQEEDEQSVRTLSHRAESIPVDQLVELLALNGSDLELERRGIPGGVASSFLGIMIRLWWSAFAWKELTAYVPAPKGEPPCTTSEFSAQRAFVYL